MPTAIWRRDMMESRRVISWKRITVLEILTGVVILVITFVISANIDMRKAESSLLTTVKYMKEQCNDSLTRDLASEAKSLLQVTESTEQINWRLKYEAERTGIRNREEDFLKNLVKDHYLHGLILLDKEGTIEEAVDLTGLGSEKVLNLADLDALMDPFSFPEKNYTLRVVREDGSHVDLASVKRMDEDGVVVGYFYTSSEYCRIINNSIRSIVLGLSPETDGTIVISSGDQVVFSNNPALENTKVEDLRILKRIMERGVGKKMVHARNRAHLLSNDFGVMDKSKEYYIYAFMDEKSVFTTTISNVLYVLFAYLLLMFILNMLMWRADKAYQKKQIEIQRSYADMLREKNRQLEEALIQAKKAAAAKSSFLSRMSHDMRTPLNGIMGLLKIDEEHFENQELVRENHKKMQVSAKHLLSLINDVLQMSKLEDGNTYLTHECIDLPRFSRKLAATVRERAMENGIEWTYEREKSESFYPYIYGSPVHLRQIFLNIYGNCIKYNKPGGKITTSVSVLGAENGICTYQWKISDTGVGMSREFLEHIFEPFEQEKNDARSVYQGTGLGMTIVKGLLEQMGGRISIDSEKGVGSTFVVTIPFEIAPAPKHSEQAERRVDAANVLHGLHVMVAEDNELNAEIAETMFTDEGAKVTVVHNGKQAVDLFAESPQGTFDVILMDLMMPVMDGLAATRAIREMKRPDAAAIPIIAMTAKAFREDVETCLDAGMNVHLAKPLDMERAKQVICELLMNTEDL